MDIRCPFCATLYEFDESRIPAEGLNLRCSACKQVFRVRTSGKVQWMLRRKGSTSIEYFDRLTDLQRLIADGTVSREDEISRSGTQWKPLVEIQELASIFNVVERMKSVDPNAVHSTIGSIASRAPAARRAEPTTAKTHGRPPVVTPEPPRDAPPRRATPLRPAPSDQTQPMARQVVQPIPLGGLPTATLPSLDETHPDLSTTQRAGTGSPPPRPAPPPTPKPATPSRRAVAMKKPDTEVFAQKDISFSEASQDSAVSAVRLPKQKRRSYSLGDEGEGDDYTLGGEVPQATRGYTLGDQKLDAPSKASPRRRAPSPPSGPYSIQGEDTFSDDFAAVKRPGGGLFKLLGALLLVGVGAAIAVFFLRPDLLGLDASESEVAPDSNASAAEDAGEQSLPASASEGSAAGETPSEGSSEVGTTTEEAAEATETAADSETQPEAEEEPSREPDPEPERSSSRSSSSSSGNSYDSLMDRGNEALEEGDPHAALEAFERAADAYNRAEAHVGLARAYEQLGRYELAAARYERATGVNDRYTPAWLGLGDARRRSGDREGAIEAYERVIEIRASGSTARRAREALEELR